MNAERRDQSNTRCRLHIHCSFLSILSNGGGVIFYHRVICSLWSHHCVYPVWVWPDLTCPNPTLEFERKLETCIGLFRTAQFRWFLQNLLVENLKMCFDVSYKPQAPQRCAHCSNCIQITIWPSAIIATIRVATKLVVVNMKQGLPWWETCFWKGVASWSRLCSAEQLLIQSKAYLRKLRKFSSKSINAWQDELRCVKISFSYRLIRLIFKRLETNWTYRLFWSFISSDHLHLSHVYLVILLSFNDSRQIGFIQLENWEKRHICYRYFEPRRCTQTLWLILSQNLIKS